MQKINFEYKGVMIKITNKLSETFKYDIPLKTVKEALDVLNEHYAHKLEEYTSLHVNIVFKKDDDKSILLNSRDSLDIELGQVNKISFYYPFKGG